MRQVQTIIRSLANNEVFTKKVFPFLKEEYFEDPNHYSDVILFKIIRDHITQYGQSPSKEQLLTTIPNVRGYTDQALSDSYDIANAFDYADIVTNVDWLVNITEEFCKQRALDLACFEAIEIIGGNSKKDRGTVPQLLSDALAVSFTTSIGHDYFTDAHEAFLLRKLQYGRVPFGIEILNRITKGGLPEKTLSVVLGGINVGKTLCMCALAGDNLAKGKNVLYITLEMSREQIRNRIDANLLNVSLSNIDDLQEKEFLGKVNEIRLKTSGNLIIEEFATAGASTIQFENLINELQMKRKFKPDIIYIDYINICASSRIKRLGNSSYEYIKSIAEELRGMAVKLAVPVVTGTQLTRSGFKSSDPDMGDVAESFGLPATADFMVVITTNPELEKLGQFMVKQIKNRFENKSKCPVFVIGVDYDHQRLYDIEAPQANIVQKQQSAGPTLSEQAMMTPAQLLTKKPHYDPEKFRSWKF